MKAIAMPRYGDSSTLRLIDRPCRVPADDEVLVEVHSVSLNALDWRMLRADPFLVRFHAGLFRPRYAGPGADFAGVVAAVGRSVRRVRVGQEVFGDAFQSGLSALAEFVVCKEAYLAPKPSNLDFDRAAAIPLAGTTALQALDRWDGVVPGQEVLIHGAGGGVGQFLVQIALARGARVTAVCGPRNAEVVRDLGAQRVLDYTSTDFAAGSERYHRVVAANGNRSLADYRRVLHPGAICVVVGGSMSQVFRALLLGPFLPRPRGVRLEVLTLDDSRRTSDLEELGRLARSGSLAPRIDRVYGLDQTAQAIDHLHAGHARGKVVVRVKPPRLELPGDSGREAAA